MTKELLAILDYFHCCQPSVVHQDIKPSNILLGQGEMRVLFEDSVNLSPSLVSWLKQITQPSLDLRLKSAKQALEALEKPNLLPSILGIGMGKRERDIDSDRIPFCIDLFI